jgi:hypothetical protein
MDQCILPYEDVTSYIYIYIIIVIQVIQGPPDL